ncbi:MAG: hypothetical protein DMG49_23560 [Acidobacteria bacterium]|nr:MAG: hypothetical protein DMG49_23560 [Acidobacteriota bacterium]
MFSIAPLQQGEPLSQKRQGLGSFQSTSMRLLCFQYLQVQQGNFQRQNIAKSAKHPVHDRMRQRLRTLEP